MEKFNFKNCSSGLVLGGSSGIASAFLDNLKNNFPDLKIFSPSRLDSELLEESWWSDYSNDLGNIDFFINFIGVLSKDAMPEKSVKNLSLDNSQYVMDVNCNINLLAMKYLKDKFSRDRMGLFCVLSAKIGSIEDNRLGGWYSYRMSKAALNMALKTFSLEVRTSKPKLICIAQHPGTTKTNLTKNFLKNISYSVKSTNETSQILIDLWNNLNQEDSGKFFNWDGEVIPW